MSAKQDFQFKKWQCLLQEFPKSGMNLKDWCAGNGITKDQYYYWLNRIRSKYYEAAVAQIQSSEAGGNVAITSSAKTGPFVEITPEMVNGVFKQESQPAAVVQKGNIRINIMPNATTSFIRQLLTAVQYD